MSKRRRQNQMNSAVGLRYEGEGAPRVTARGVGPVADEIIALAREHGVPVQEDRHLVELLSELELGDEIPRELYIAVAEVLAFAYLLTGKFPEAPEREKD